MASFPRRTCRAHFEDDSRMSCSGPRKRPLRHGWLTLKSLLQDRYARSKHDVHEISRSFHGARHHVGLDVKLPQRSGAFLSPRTTSLAAQSSRYSPVLPRCVFDLGVITNAVVVGGSGVHALMQWHSDLLLWQIDKPWCHDWRPWRNFLEQNIISTT